MKFHSIALNEGATARNLTIQGGAAFPAAPGEGELFYRNDADTRVKGLYLYVNGSWDRISSTEALTVPSGAVLPTVSNPGDLFYQNGSGMFFSDGTTWTPLNAGGSADTAGDLSGGAAGSLPYQAATSSTAFLPAGTVNQVLVSGAAPSWTGSPVLSTIEATQLITNMSGSTVVPALLINSNPGLTVDVARFNSGGTTVMGIDKTGTLRVNGTSPSIVANAAVGTNSSNLYFQAGGLNRWRMGKDTTVETGANAGSDFFINSYQDDGSAMNTRVSISRSSGVMTVPAGINANVTGTLTGNASSASTVPWTGVTGRPTLHYSFTNGVPSPAPTSFPIESISGFNAYSSTDFPTNYWTGITVLNPGLSGFQLAANWDSEEIAPSGLIFRVNDDTTNVSAWGPWTTIWNSRNLTNVSQLTNDAGYLTSATADSSYVNVAGDTMTGNLQLTGANLTLRSVVNGSDGIVRLLDNTGTLRGGFYAVGSSYTAVEAYNSSQLRLNIGGQTSAFIMPAGFSVMTPFDVNGGYARITQTSGVQRILMGNQDAGGANNPAIIQAANGTIAFGNGDTWTASGGTMNKVVEVLPSRVDVFQFIDSYRGDNGAIVRSFNTSAGNAAQFSIYHSFADTVIEAQRGTLRLNVSGNINLIPGGTAQVGGNTIWHAGNFNPGSYLPLAGGTLTGQLNVNNGVSYPGYFSGLNVGYTGSGTQFGITLKPATNTAGTNAITFLTSTSTPASPAQVGAIQQTSGDGALNLVGTWLLNGSGIANTSALSSYVAKSGDTMSGDLTIARTNPVLRLRDTDGTGSNMSAWVSFRDSGDGERGWVGFGENSTVMRVSNPSGDLRLSASNVHVDGNGITSRAIAFPTETNILDEINGSPWYGVGRTSSDIFAEGSTQVHVAGYYGLRLRSANALIDMRTAGNINISSTRVTTSSHLDVGGTLSCTSTAAFNTNAILGRGADVNFQLWARNGSGNNANGERVSDLMLAYAGVSGETAGLRFYRGGGATDTVMSFWAHNAERMSLNGTALSSTVSQSIARDGVAHDPYGVVSVTRNTSSNYSYYGLTRAGQLGMGLGISTTNRFIVGSATAGHDGVINSPAMSLSMGGDVSFGGSITAGGTITTGGVEVGYLGIPTLSTTGGTAGTNARGRCYETTGAITVPSGTFTAGDTFTIDNVGGGNITIVQGGGLTMYLAGTTTTGNRTLAVNGICTIRFRSSSVCVISGGGLT